MLGQEQLLAADVAGYCTVQTLTLSETGSLQTMQYPGWTPLCNGVLPFVLCAPAQRHTLMTLPFCCVLTLSAAVALVAAVCQPTCRLVVCLHHVACHRCDADGYRLPALLPNHWDLLQPTHLPQAARTGSDHQLIPAPRALCYDGHVSWLCTGRLRSGCSRQHSREKQPIGTVSVLCAGQPCSASLTLF